MANLSERAEITVERVLRELAKIGFSDIRKAVAWRNEMVAREDEEAGKGEDGVVSVTRVLLPRVSIVPSEEMDPDIAAAIAQISQGPNGEVRVRLHDKHAALVSIGKHLGMFVDRVQIQERKQISAEPMSAEEWKRQFVREGCMAATGRAAAGSKFRRTCNLHACGLGVACRELRAIGLTGDGLPLPRKERPTCGARNRQGKPCAVKVERQAEMPFPRQAVDSPPAAPPYKISVASLSSASHCFGWRSRLSSPEVDGRSERRKVFVIINPRDGLRHLAVEAVGDLANALHVAGDGLSAQRPCDRG
jgi:hypothetical protein